MLLIFSRTAIPLFTCEMKVISISEIPLFYHEEESKFQKNAPWKRGGFQFSELSLVSKNGWLRVLTGKAKEIMQRISLIHRTSNDIRKIIIKYTSIVHFQHVEALVLPKVNKTKARTTTVPEKKTIHWISIEKRTNIFNFSMIEK